MRVRAKAEKLIVCKVDEWWKMIDEHRGKWGIAVWAHDFVSIHKGRRGQERPYSLMGPSKVAADDGTRPSWESVNYRTKAEALRDAKRVARRLGFRGVVCCVTDDLT